MQAPSAREFRFGDRVTVSWRPGVLTPARIVAMRQGDAYVPGSGVVETQLVVVTTHLPHMVHPGGVRVLPIGTPAYVSFPVTDVSLLGHDPAWNPHRCPPNHTPDDIRVLSGHPRWRIPSESYRSIVHVGAYLPGPWYPKRAPVWAWDDGWREAHVDGTSRGWIRLGLSGDAGRFPAIKAFRPVHVSPVLCPEADPPLRVDWEEGLWPGYEHYDDEDGEDR